MKRKKLFTLLGSVCLVLVLVVLLIPACAKEAPVPTPTPTVPTPAPVEPVTIRYASWTTPPPANAHARGIAWYWDKVRELTEGRVQTEYYWGGTLFPAKETMSSLKDGLGDAASIMPNYHPGLTPLWNVGSLVVSNDMWAVTRAEMDLAKHPALKEELARWNTMFAAPCGTAPNWLVTTKPVTKIEDLKGLKINVIGEMAKVLLALGAVPVSMGRPEVYEALAKGTIDGANCHYATLKAYKWCEVAKYNYMLPLGSSLIILAITEDTWNKISPEDQKVMIDLREYHCMNYAQDYWINGFKEGKEVSDAAGMQETYPSTEDLAKLNEALEPLWDSWAQTQEKEGRPGREVVDLWVSSVQKYEAQSLFKDIRY